MTSLLPLSDGADDSQPQTLLFAAAGLLALIVASGSLARMLGRLIPPTAVLLVLLGPPSSAVAQTITPNCDTPDGARDTCSHWYNASKVSLSWSVAPGGGEHVSGCQVGSFTLETAPLYRECRWSWSGSVYTANIWIGIDRTAPQVTGFDAGRPPDHDGWFNHPVALKFKGSDGLSGVADCGALTYSGPDGAPAQVNGSCTDVAGNTGTEPLLLNYDTTAPPAPAVTALPGDGTVRLQWTSTPDAEAEVARVNGGESMVVYRGRESSFTDGRLRNQERYRYVVSLIDQAGNRSSGEASAVPTASPLLTPSAQAKLARPPLLRWRRVRGASYYNVQLFRGRRKVLSRWPRDNQFQLRQRWRFGGKPRRLVPGRYCWYVWPGFGPRRERKYGRVLGRRCFTVVR